MPLGIFVTFAAIILSISIVQLLSSSRNLVRTVTVKSVQQKPNIRGGEHNDEEEAASYNSPLLNLWNSSEMNDSIAFVAHYQDQADALPEESQWLLNAPKIDSNYRTIPKRIHKIYIQKTGNFPSMEEKQGMIGLEEAHKSWVSRNPGYSVDAYNLAGCRKYLAKNFHPIFLRAFDCISGFAGKADFFRIAVVYLEGGWYSDWKQVCLQDGLLESLGSNANLYIVWDRGNVVSIRDRCLQTAFFGASPFHPVLATMLKMMLNNVGNEVYGESSLHTTGPCLLNQAYFQFLNEQNPNKTSVREGIFSESESESDLFNIYSSDNPSLALIQHKCRDCGTNQKWEMGNDYNVLWNDRTFYCPDAQSLFKNR